jgi:1-acyl-sn-glycerol-3-phosphate acyltransferase
MSTAPDRFLPSWRHARPPGHEAHPRRAAAARWLLARAGWTVHFDGLPAARGVIVVYPHTSNWDFVVGLLAIWSMDVPLRFVGKHTLFRGPQGWLMRRWGGMPVDRSQTSGMVGQLQAQIESQRWCWLALAPEGTRSLTTGWKSGFWHLGVALQSGAGGAAAAPLGLASLDFARREVRLTDFVSLRGDAAADQALLAAHYARVIGCKPQLQGPVRWDA